MAAVLAMPQLGQSMVEGTVSAWLKTTGDTVVRDESLVTVSTDKIDTDLPAPEAGTVLRICVPAGSTVEVGAPLAYIGVPGEEPPSDRTPILVAGEPAAPASSPSTRKTGFLSPVVARMLHEYGLDPAQIAGTGREGRITRKDVQTAIATRPVAPPVSGVQPLTPMRQAIAEHMTRSVHTSPHVTTFFEVDMGAVVQHRVQAQAAMARDGVHLGLLPYFMQAAVQALQQEPQVNASLLPEGLVRHASVHLGIAVAVPHGLVAPVIRLADRLDLQGLAQALAALTAKAQTRRLQAADLEGSTFSITNHGSHGSMTGTPIIHQPNAAILGIGAVVKRPVVRGGDSLLPQANDAIVIRPMCVLSLSFDHRILDGAVADSFLAHMRDTLEQWH